MYRRVIKICSEKVVKTRLRGARTKLMARAFLPLSLSFPFAAQQAATQPATNNSDANAQAEAVSADDGKPVL